MKNAVINGTGSYLPRNALTNVELETKLDTTHEWIFTRTGISSRYIADEQETTTYMASEAGKKAVEASGIDVQDIDLILVATCTPDYFFPSTACHVQKALGITRPIPAFDISAACSGFVYAMDIAKQYIQTGTVRHALVIGSETMSKTLDWNDRTTCILFGDGAGAVLLSASEKPGILATKLHSQYDHNQLLLYPNSLTIEKNAVVSMRGNEVFKLAVNVMASVVDEVLEASELTKSDIDWLVPHQANIRIIQGIAKKLHLPMSQVILTVEKQGNTSAASIPLALDHAIRNQQIKRGDLMLIDAFGGGMTWGAMVVRY